MTDASSEPGSSSPAGGSLSSGEIQRLLDSAADVLARRDRDTAVELLSRVPLDACATGQLGKAARLGKKAGARDIWAGASQRYVTRAPRSPDGYLLLLADPELIADAGLQRTALDAARSGLELLANGELTSAAVAFHVNRVIAVLRGDPTLAARSQQVADAVFGTSDDGAVWHARDLLRRGELGQAGLVLDRDAARRGEGPSEEAIVVRGRVALLGGRWGRDWEHLRAVESLRSDSARKLQRQIDEVRRLFAHLGESFDAGPTTPRFRAVSSPESVAEVICRGPHDPAGRSAAAHGLLLAGGTLGAGGAERLMATCFRELRRRDVLGQVDLALRVTEPRGEHEQPLYFLPLTGVGASDIIGLDETQTPEPPFSYLVGGIARPAHAWHRLFCARRPEVVHAWLDYTMVSAGLAAARAGVPKVILHSHNMRPESISGPDGAGESRWRQRGLGWRGIYAHLLSRPEVHLVTCSEAATADYLDWIEVDENSANVHTIHNGLDLAPFDQDGSAEATQLRAELGIPPEAPVVGTALRFAPVKQPEQWVEAAMRIRRSLPDVHFVMFGDGAGREPLMGEIEAAGAAGYIHCPGRFADVHLRLQLLDVFMLSSKVEGLPNVLLESQACGVPVVAYDVGGVRETLVDGVTGRLVREQNPAALAAVVEDVLRDRSWRVSAAAEGRRFVRREFSIDKMVSRLESLVSQ